MGRGPNTDISNKFPGGTDVGGGGPHFEKRYSTSVSFLQTEDAISSFPNTYLQNIDDSWRDVKEKEKGTHSDTLRNYQKEFITESTK